MATKEHVGSIRRIKSFCLGRTDLDEPLTEAPIASSVDTLETTDYDKGVRLSRCRMHAIHSKKACGKCDSTEFCPGTSVDLHLITNATDPVVKRLATNYHTGYFVAVRENDGSRIRFGPTFSSYDDAAHTAVEVANLTCGLLDNENNEIFYVHRIERSTGSVTEYPLGYR